MPLDCLFRHNGRHICIHLTINSARLPKYLCPFQCTHYVDLQWYLLQSCLAVQRVDTSLPGMKSVSGTRCLVSNKQVIADSHWNNNRRGLDMFTPPMSILLPHVLYHYEFFFFFSQVWSVRRRCVLASLAGGRENKKLQTYLIKSLVGTGASHTVACLVVRVNVQSVFFSVYWRKACRCLTFEHLIIFPCYVNKGDEGDEHNIQAKEIGWRWSVGGEGKKYSAAKSRVLCRALRSRDLQVSPPPPQR